MNALAPPLSLLTARPRRGSATTRRWSLLSQNRTMWRALSLAVTVSRRIGAVVGGKGARTGVRALDELEGVSVEVLGVEVGEDELDAGVIVVVHEEFRGGMFFGKGKGRSVG